MLMKKANLFLFVSLIFVLNVNGQSKKPMDHSVYDLWKDIKSPVISYQGHFVAYELRPQNPFLDGILFLYSQNENKLDSFPRGNNPVFTPNEQFVAFRVKPPHSLVKELKLKKTKKDKLPKDSLFVYHIPEDTLYTFGQLKKFKVSKKNYQIIAALFYQSKEKTQQDSNSSNIPNDTKHRTHKTGKNYKLLVWNTQSGSRFETNDVLEYSLAPEGSTVAFVQQKNNDTLMVQYYNAVNGELKTLSLFKGKIKNIILDKEGNQIAWLQSSDTTKPYVYKLFYYHIKNSEQKTLDENAEGVPDGWVVCENFNPYFSDDGKKLFLATFPKPQPEPEDSLLDEEKFHVDIWSWTDLVIQPEQKVRLKKDKTKKYMGVWNVGKNKYIQLADSVVDNIKLFQKGNSDFALGFNNKKYRKSYSWTAERYRDIYLININTGERQLFVEQASSTVELSPNQKFVYWYSKADSNWYAREIKSGKVINLTAWIKYPLYQEVFDVPALPYPYGSPGWTQNDRQFLVYDRYDIWAIAPGNPQKPVNITQFYGRKNNIRLRYVKTTEKEYIPDDTPILLHGFDEDNNYEGYYSLDLNHHELKTLIYENYHLSRPQKAKESEMYLWSRSNYRKFPDLLLSDGSFLNPRRISFANPQQKEYLWGSVEMIKWTSFDGRELKGLLYKPENFDSRKKYPVIVYYYEKNSETSNRYLNPKPSYSVISFPMYTSNGYLIFVPDIYYKTGYPGKSAFDCIMSGVLKICELPFVDKERIGLQGQSWGGYQTAYMVTQTSFFKAAMAGAPVSNMTSAYGGIRWGSGLSRMFQYEEGQSRIGGNLWEYPERYIENSPLFQADKITTPLLIMHNDNDGAVPWYQGIELFLALRRLNKPVWMLTYNNEEHNLRKWPNRVDLSIRMMQFFDHYLKNKPAPRWMVEGIPADKKGLETGYELMEK